MVTKRISVTIDSDDLMYCKDRSISVSKLLRRAVNDLKEGRNVEDMKKKMIVWQTLFYKARDLCELHGLEKEFSEGL